MFRISCARNHRTLNSFCSSYDRERQRLVSADQLPHFHLFPGGIANAVNLNDMVPGLDASLFSGRVVLNRSYDRRFVHVSGMLVMHHEHAGEQHDRQQNVHYRAGDGDQKTVPARVIHELARIVGVAVHRVLATHLDVAAQRDSVDPVIGLALTETDQTLAEADGELLHPHTQ